MRSWWKKYWSLCAASMAVLILVVGVGGCLLLKSIEFAKADDVAAALTAVGTVGGLVSSLSLTGTAVLSLSGRYRETVLRVYGRLVRGMIFGGFTSVVCLSLLFGFALVWKGEEWLKALLAFGSAYMVVVLSVTALLLTAAFRKNSAQ